MIAAFLTGMALGVAVSGFAVLCPFVLWSFRKCRSEDARPIVTATHQETDFKRG